MEDTAAGRPVAIFMDNAPYHSRQLEKHPPTHRRRPQLLITFSRKLHAFVSNRGGVGTLYNYAVENVCAEFGVAVISKRLTTQEKAQIRALNYAGYADEPMGAHDKRQIYRRTYNSCLSPNKIRAELKVTVSESSDWRALHLSGNVALEIVKKAARPIFRHKTAQLEFA
ncbi:hypothetical protein ANCCEY_09144 [Ancylostoma ceylanicum]|uniref:Transposable element Tc3 transposase-like DNA-binding HTH domain-containing protein n=1 Tax=Ancylostoma ceylanicum TaxID=53326 RepID=A0A0D6LIB5_9BILA|nr:hypothetical protein ANCCEY_09144 [Ancylostoma ceylanicum]